MMKLISHILEKNSIYLMVQKYFYIGILGEGRGIDLIVEAFKDNELKSHLIFRIWRIER